MDEDFNAGERDELRIICQSKEVFERHFKWNIFMHTFPQKS